MIGSWKLTETDVEVIKYLFERTDLRDGEIAEMFDVSRVHINRIRHGKRWNEDIRSFEMKKPLKSNDLREFTPIKEHTPTWFYEGVEKMIEDKIKEMMNKDWIDLD